MIEQEASNSQRLYRFLGDDWFHIILSKIHPKKENGECGFDLILHYLFYVLCYGQIYALKENYEYLFNGNWQD